MSTTMFHTHTKQQAKLGLLLLLLLLLLIANVLELRLHRLVFVIQAYRALY